METQPNSILRFPFKLKWIPNILSGARIMLAILFPTLDPYYWTMTLTIALITEFLDGFLARRYHWESLSGQILDPVADRFLALIVALTFIITVPALTFPLIAILSRDILVTLGLFWVLIRIKRLNSLKLFRPNLLGKWTTFLQYLVFYNILLSTKLWIEFVWFTGILSFCAGIYYVYIFEKNMKKITVK